MLDEHPNVMVEFGAREAELGRQPRQAREFFLKYQDRVMFGTDNGTDEAMYRNLFRWLETGGRVVRLRGDIPAQGRWEIYGLGVCRIPVLEKIYHLNAERLFSQFKGLSKWSSEGANTMKSGTRNEIVVRATIQAGKMQSLLGLPVLFLLSASCSRPPAEG
jgi:uncharacterized pyridoxamine 5'-phosphate oxidase family protein